MTTDTTWGLIEGLRAGSSTTGVSFRAALGGTQGRRRETFGVIAAGAATPIAIVTPLDNDAGPVFSGFNMGWYGVGRVAFSGEVQRRNPAFESFNVLALDDRWLAMEADDPPGGGAPYDNFDVQGSNDAGDVLFLGIFGRGRNSTRSLIVRHAPTNTSTGSPFLLLGAPGGAVPIAGNPAWSDDAFNTRGRAFIGGGGQVVFRGTLAGAADSANEVVVVFERDAATRLVAREGDAVPGLPGVVFGRLERPASALSTNTIAINGQGNVLLRAELEGAGVTPRNNDSLWGWDRSAGDLILLLRTGNMITVDGAPHVLTDFEVQLGSGAQDGLPSGYNDRGQIALVIRYEPVGGGAAVASGGTTPGMMLIETASGPGGVPSADAGTSAGTDSGTTARTDAGAAFDGGPGHDVGEVPLGAPGTGGKRGCNGCRTTPGEGGNGWGLIALLGLFLVRRR